MKKHKKIGAKILSMVMTSAMAVAILPATVFAVENLTECHVAHTADCGYIAAEVLPCAHLNEDGSYSCTPVSGTGVVKADGVCPHDDECGYTPPRVFIAVSNAHPRFWSLP